MLKFLRKTVPYIDAPPSYVLLNDFSNLQQFENNDHSIETILWIWEAILKEL
jgi:hypothetical protein